MSDVVDVLRTLIAIKNGDGKVDDIDHLGNRRVRCVGEMAEVAFRIGLVRVERAVKERLTLAENEEINPQDMINAKPVAAAVKEFFGSSQLSQFMDQNNPLSEITHKRRVSALGEGGFKRERAGFESRRAPDALRPVCPIETPEGPNIGLITRSRLRAHQQVRFLETPYRACARQCVTGDWTTCRRSRRASVIRPTFAPLDRAHPAVMRRVHVAHLESGALALESALAQRRDAALVGDFGQRVVLVHELRELRGAEDSLTAAATGFALIMSCGLISSFSASVRRSLTARSTRTRPMRKATSAISPTQRTRRLPRWSMSSTLPSPFLIAISVRSTSTTSDISSPYLPTSRGRCRPCAGPRRSRNSGRQTGCPAPRASARPPHP